MEPIKIILPKKPRPRDLKTTVLTHGWQVASWPHVLKEFNATRTQSSWRACQQSSSPEWQTTRTLIFQNVFPSPCYWGLQKQCWNQTNGKKRNCLYKHFKMTIRNCYETQHFHIKICWQTSRLLTVANPAAATTFYARCYRFLLYFIWSQLKYRPLWKENNNIRCMVTCRDETMIFRPCGGSCFCSSLALVAIFQNKWTCQHICHRTDVECKMYSVEGGV